MITRSKKYSYLDFFQILSIDVVLGTLAIGYLATRILNVKANSYWWIILPLTVWVVYSMDHIIDGIKTKGQGIIFRHRFHYIHRKPIIIIVIVAALLSITLSLFFLEKQIILFGLILSVITVFYFTSVYLIRSRKSIILQKELIIAAVYTSGVFVAPLVWFGKLPSYPALLVIFNLFVLAWLEGVMISWFDYSNDIQDGHTSFTVIVGKRNARRIMLIVHSLLELGTIALLLTTSYSIAFYALVITLIMNFLLGLIIMFPDSYLSKNYHRLIGETVFFLPALIVFF